MPHFSWIVALRSRSHSHTASGLVQPFVWVRSQFETRSSSCVLCPGCTFLASTSTSRPPKAPAGRPLFPAKREPQQVTRRRQGHAILHDCEY